MAKRKKSLTAPGFTGALIITIIVILLLIIFPGRKLFAIGDNFFSFFEFNDKTKEKTSKAQATISLLSESYEFCRSIDKNDCLCDSGKYLNFDIGKELKISKKDSNIELEYDDEKEEINNVEFCVTSTIVRPGDKFYTFDNSISDIKNSITLYKTDTGKIVRDFNGITEPFELEPIKLYKHKEGNKLYLCLAKYGLDHNPCQ